MRPLDWVVLVTSLVSIVAYGLYRSRGSNTVDRYLLAGKTMPWYAMALSIMATQASAITFISTTGQSYVDGMRFVQFYFGLPIAMVIICATVVPVFHRAKSLHRVRIPGEALRRQDARAGQRHLPLPARPFRRADHLCAGHRALRHPGMAGARHHLADGRDGGHLHGARRHQGRHLVGRAADVRHLPGPGDCAGHRHRAAAAVRLLRRRRFPGGRGGPAERRHHPLRLERPLQHLERPARRHVSVPLLFRLRPVAGAALPDRQLHRPEPP